ncbi:hypothetical protein [Streptomyces sp. NBC_01800]|uniref:hypothetical protein n=1 Tax=Streptomyces sp. NBC_01800 TaxID=2975945 RepID=UPI002DD8DF78|nr:hypothetical protein [Streptomyces sp. NBC_01800]WSA68819.1 hypothetical protein OIE65_18535 [Streptomyces sp. NBC_01800]
MPDHGRVNRREWQALWLQYEAVTTPLRAAGLACDIETCGGETVIYVNLPDGTHLVVADEHSLPDRLDDVTGWRIVRSHEDTPTFDGLIYDSTAEGEHGKNATDIKAMLAAVAIYLHNLPDADTKTAGQVLGESLVNRAQLYGIGVLGVTPEHTADARIVSEPFDTHLEAVKEYGFYTHQLAQHDWQQVHEQGGTEWPLTVWQRRQVVRTVFVTPIGS